MKLQTENKAKLIYESEPSQITVLGNIKIEVSNRMLITVTKVTTTTERTIPLKIVSHIKKCLEKFEKKQGFLDADLKLTKLAEQFETNTKYLSKVILKEKGKPFKTYIKDLKVAFAKSRIDTEYKFRRYKMKVIANECGFKTGESFSKHFLETYGIYPSKYIKKVETNFKKDW